ncbi:MAG TPA: hypothetical protein VF730_14285 [Terracidiphilus sp.]
MLYRKAWRRTSQVTLRISVYEYDKSVGITLEGRVAGPWVAELSRVWAETVPQLNSRMLILDLRNVTYADLSGTDALKAMCAQSHPKLITGSPWTEYLAQEISKVSQGSEKEIEHASHA